MSSERSESVAFVLLGSIKGSVSDTLPLMLYEEVLCPMTQGLLS